MVESMLSGSLEVINITNRNAQIAGAYFSGLRHHLSAGTSAYGRPKNDTPRIVDGGIL